MKNIWTVIVPICLLLMVSFTSCERSQHVDFQGKNKTKIVSIIDQVPDIEYVMHGESIVNIGGYDLYLLCQSTLGIDAFIVDREYAIVKDSWIPEVLSPRFLELYTEAPAKDEEFDPAKYSVYDCDNYARDFSSFARLTHSVHTTHNVESIAIGDVYIMMDMYDGDTQIGHVLNIVVVQKKTDAGNAYFALKFFEPQTGKFVSLSDYGTTEIMKISF